MGLRNSRGTAPVSRGCLRVWPVCLHLQSSLLGVAGPSNYGIGGLCFLSALRFRADWKHILCYCPTEGIHVVCSLYIEKCDFGDGVARAPVLIGNVPPALWGAKNCGLCKSEEDAASDAFDTSTTTASFHQGLLFGSPWKGVSR